MVLWMLSLLTIIASSFVFSTKLNMRLAGNLLGVARAQSVADAGVNRAIYSLSTPDADPLRWRGDGREHIWVFQGEKVRITIRDEAGKIDVNSASDELIRNLFRSAGLDEQRAASLLDAILDWRDEDSFRRPNGAELADYNVAGLPYGPANSRFQTIGELRQVLGMTDDLYQRIVNNVTVYSGQNGINSGISPREVLLALPGSDPAQVDAYIALREATAPGINPPVFPPAQAFSAGESRVFSILAEAMLQDGSFFAREAVVRLQQDIKNPVVYLAWRAHDLSNHSRDGENAAPRKQDVE